MTSLTMLMSNEPESATVFSTLRFIQAFDRFALFHIRCFAFQNLFCCSMLVSKALLFLPCGYLAAEPPILHGDGFLKSPY